MSLIQLFRVVALAIALVGIMAVMLALCLRNVIALYVVAGFWALGAPLWFIFEFWLYNHITGAKPGFGQFRHGQLLAAALWVGVGAVIAMLLESPFVASWNH